MAKTGNAKVVIVGAGFGGLSVAKTLGNRGTDVTLVDRNNYHGFWPLLYQVATGGLEAASIAYPIRGIVRPYKNVNFRLGTVTGVDWDKKEVNVENGPAIPYDYLVLAAGSAQFYFGNDVLAEKTFSMKDVDEAEQIRNHVIECFEKAVYEADPEKKKQLMTVAIVGGGPTGVELAGAFTELFKEDFVHDFKDKLDLSMARVIIIEAMDKIMMPFGDPKDAKRESGFQAATKETLIKKGVEIMLSKPVDGVDDNVVKFKDGSTLAAGTVIWAAGVRGALLADKLGLKLQRGFRVPVTEFLQLEDKPEVFVIGDMAYLEGFQWGERTMAYPMLAQVAIQMGECAANNINILASGQNGLHKFSYFDKGTMAIIGRNAAIVDGKTPFPMRMYKNGIERYFGWITWLLVHVMFLFGWRNRLVSIFNWCWNWWFKDRGARVLVGKVDEKTEAIVSAP